MRKVLGFQEFNPSAYAEKIDWRTILLRWTLIASIVVVPVLMLAFEYLWFRARFVVYFMGVIVALYAPALALIRRPRVSVSKDFVITVKAPKTVDTRILVKAACSALVYFGLLAFTVFVLEGRI